MTKKTDNDREIFNLTIKRRDYLQGIKDRLSREVGFYIECANERRRKDGNLQLEGVAMAAMLMPFIEDLSRRDG